MALSLSNQAKTGATSFLLFCFSLFLTGYSARHPEIAQVGFSVLTEIQRPFQIVTQRIHTTIEGTVGGYFDLINVRQENQHLRDRLHMLEVSNSSLLEFKSENERLRKLLGVKEERKFSGIASTVIGYDPTHLSETVILDRGSADGVSAEMPVVQGESVVGQIVAVSTRSSRALLIIDPSSGVDSIVQNSRARGVLKGTARASISELQYVVPEDEIKVGDRIITSGLDQIFPKGLLVGIVAEVNHDPGSMFQNINVKPSVDFHKLENVLIVTGGPKEK